MKTETTKTIAGVLIPCILVSSCTPSTLFSYDSIETINLNEGGGNPVLPIDTKSNEFRRLFDGLSALVHDVIRDPSLAKEAIDNSPVFFEKYGIAEYATTYRTDFIDVLSFLADEDIINAIHSEDAQQLFALVKAKGYLVSYTEDEIRTIADYVSTKSGIVAAAFVFVMAVAGMAIVAVAETAVYETTFFWDGEQAPTSESLLDLLEERNPGLIDLCSLALNKKDTLFIASLFVEDQLSRSLKAMQPTKVDESVL